MYVDITVLSLFNVISLVSLNAIQCVSESECQSKGKASDLSVFECGNVIFSK